jgi:hypothetical protein
MNVIETSAASALLRMSVNPLLTKATTRRMTWMTANNELECLWKEEAVT